MIGTLHEQLSIMTTVVSPNKQKSIEPLTILFAPEVEPKDTINILINYSYIFLHIIIP